MIIDVNSTPSYVVGDLIARYTTAQLDVLSDAMSDYLQQDGKPMLSLFLEPDTRMLASDGANLLRRMSEENLWKVINSLDDHLLEIYKAQAQSDEAEYHSDVMNWVSLNPESWRI